MKRPKRKSYLFRKASSRQEMSLLIADVCQALRVVGWCQFSAGFFYGTYLWLDALLIFAGAGLLRRYESRPAALLLLILSINTLIATMDSSPAFKKVGATHIVIAILFLYCAGRGVYGAIRIHRRFPAPVPPPLPPPAAAAAA